ncbi:hypothetical protein llap_6482 [Limosa lapponica baueri]|uniref:Uncharacterized protein n=1 Tax=Limosa lapponica baueri TaxID=1758121 RepID=A0A2I0UB11_LIMLA|nr:hypothetical protein llap_6482 [Limosa lapponica baueri]
MGRRDAHSGDTGSHHCPAASPRQAQASCRLRDNFHSNPARVRVEMTNIPPTQMSSHDKCIVMVLAPELSISSFD